MTPGPTDPQPAAEPRLSELAVQRLEALRREEAALRALAELAEILDPAGRLPAWPLAQAIEGHLRRFESTAWVRIQRGGRAPKNPAEHAMALYLAAGLPRSARRIWDFLL